MGSRAGGCLAVALLVTSLAALAVGLVIVLTAGASTTSGVGGALAGLGQVVGVALIVFGAIALLAGAIVVVLAARERRPPERP